MGGIIPKHTIENIRAQNDIVEVIGSYLQLKRAGSAYKTCCPFHKEKTPSFSVNPQRQIYHCFGCHAGGDVFRFIMEYEGVDFVMAARLLAERVGIQLEYEDGDGQDRSEKSTLYKIHEDVTTLFHRILMEMSNAEPARNYLKERDIGEDIVKDFLIGYAPERRDTMRQFAKNKKYSFEQLEKAGLMAKAQNGDYYDRFRKRLMIPIRDQLGRVIAFTGRIIDPNQRGGKYVNSPETMLFQKSRVLFAFDRARKAIVDSRQAIICEGQIDAIRCHQAGIHTVVASQGTALTEQHARLLKRYADSVVFVLDSDKPGQDAAIRSAEIFLAAGLALKVVALPEGEDPDTLIQQHGPQPFLDLVSTAQSIVDFHISVLRDRDNLDSEEGLMRAVHAVLSVIRHAQSAVQRDHLLRQAAEQLGLRDEALRQDLRRMESRRRPARSQDKKDEGELPPVPKEHPKEEMQIIELLLVHPEVAEWINKYLRPEHMSDPMCRKLLMLILEHQGDEDWHLTDELADEDAECVRLAAKIQIAPREVNSTDVKSHHAAQDLIMLIRRKRMEERQKVIRQKMEGADSAKQDQLRQESGQLKIDIYALRQDWQHALTVLDLDAL